MIYQFSIRRDTENNLVEALVTCESVNFLLNNSPQNFYAQPHSSIIDLISTDRAKLEHFVSLMVSNSNTAFGVFCAENQIQIPVMPEENQESPLINGSEETPTDV